MAKLSCLWFFLSLWSMLFWAGPVIAAPALTGDLLPQRRQEEGKTPLRILPLGASITWGLASSDNNGYRKALRDQLRSDGFDVNMVGSRSNGEMADNDVEATSGYIIDEVRAAAANSLIYKPNVVLINAGTNDCRRNLAIDTAGERMRALIMDLLTAPDMSHTLIVLSTLLQSGNEITMSNQPLVNAQYRNLVTDLRGKGHNIVLAEMDPQDGEGSNRLTYPDSFADVTHPNDQGYKIMASIWYDAIKAAVSQGMISPAAEVDLGDGTGTCNKTPGTGIYAGGHTQRGGGEDDGIYYHSSQTQGIVFSFDSNDDNDLKVFFGRLYRQDRDDILIWEKNNGVARYDTYMNTGATTNRFKRVGWTSIADNCNETGAHFIDINGDGLDDFVCIGLDGTAYASVNNGDGTPTSPPSFTYLGKWKDREGSDQAAVRLGDVDGDGRADYCVLAANGDIRCWRNGWVGEFYPDISSISCYYDGLLIQVGDQDDLPKYWQPLGVRFTGGNMGDLRGIRFEDINGDGRDDWLWVNVDGQTTTWTNSRSCDRGVEGEGLKIVWRQGFQEGKSSGPTHPGMGSFATSGLRNRVHFARIIGQPQDFGLLGRQDYAFFDIKAKESGGYTWDLHVWKNVGHGATKIKADGNRYCNMQGHEDGRMDFVWILSKGDMRIYPNKGLSEFSDSSESYWGSDYVIFDPSSVFGRDLDRRDLHLADWDGDGVCDIIWTDPDNANRMHVWRNRIKETGSYNWEYHFDGTPSCNEKRGIGFFDRPVHMADITGNGMADYLCVEPDGRTWGYVHDSNGWEYMDQIKFAEDRDRANLQWADVNGDGRADLIHTNKFTGDGTVWYSNGRKDIGGSRFHWVNSGVLYSGAAAGACTYFPDLDGDGRADLHAIINSLDNTADSWYNRCGGVKDHTGDDGPIIN
ncbi:hypothetical protein BJX63DRAFT_428611 [Aspergillus granulosus]|uniref:SGNH hydrolase-type esterase domain-containing protein n=1 Tax=Aspergillus granulosus TaxID=176169 RepID=A0ABR4HXK8_9EURO